MASHTGFMTEIYIKPSLLAKRPGHSMGCVSVSGKHLVCKSNSDKASNKAKHIAQAKAVGGAFQSQAHSVHKKALVNLTNRYCLEIADSQNPYRP